MTFMDLLASPSTFYLMLLVLRCLLRVDGEESTLCYIRKDDQQTLICEDAVTKDPVTFGECCPEYMSDIHVNIFYKDGCNSTSKCHSGHACCTRTWDHSDVSTDGKRDMIISVFRSTNCFREVTPSQLPGNRGINLVVISFTCKHATPESSSESPTTVTTETAMSDATPERSSESPTTVTTETAMSDKTSNVVIALAVSLSIVSVAFVVVVTVMCLKRNRATPKTSMSKVDGSGTMTHDPGQASPSGIQYMNVVPPTYEQLSREHTDGEYSELSKEGVPPQQEQHLGSRDDQSVYYNETQQAGKDGDYVIVM